MDELKVPDDMRETFRKQICKWCKDVSCVGYSQQEADCWCWRNTSLFEIVSPLLAAAELKGGQEERERIKYKWLDKPDKGGWWWKAVFMDDKCCGVTPMRVIDYDRQGRALEVDDGQGDTIPVDKYKENYYPNSKWLYIPEPKYPNWQSLGGS